MGGRKDWVAELIFRTGVFAVFRAGMRWRRARPDGGQSFLVLVYHRVSSDPGPYLPSVPATLFREQMEYVASHFKPLRAREAVEGALQGQCPEDALVVTFDDGYRDNVEVAWPIMKRLGVPLTVFVSTDAVTNREVLWHDQVFRLFSEAPDPSPCRVLLASWTGREPPPHAPRAGLRDAVLAFLKRLPPAERQMRLDELAGALRTPRVASDPNLMMSWDEVRRLAREGVEIGAHGVRHCILSVLDAQELDDEVRRSREAIEAEAGVTPEGFAYPNGRRGDFGDREAAVVREAGFVYAMTTETGIATLRGADDAGRWRLPRYGRVGARVPRLALGLESLSLAAS